MTDKTVFSRALSLGKTFSVAMILALSACSIPPKVPPAERHKPVTPPEPQPPKQPEQVLETIGIQQPGFDLQPQALPIGGESDLQQRINTADLNGDWVSYLELNQQFWQASDDEGREKIEYAVWQKLQLLSDSNVAQLEQEPSRIVQSWIRLLKASRSSADKLENRLQQVRQEEPFAIYQAHLLPQLIDNFSDLTSYNNIAVLLPLQGRYQQVGEQIKEGILKAYFASERSGRIQFYDTSDPSRIENTYYQAKQDGADMIIGPLLKESIQQLIPLNDADIIALNRVDNAPFTEFSFKSAHEIGQLIQRLNAYGYKNLGILTPDSAAQLKQAQELKNQWELENGHQAVLQTYPDDNPRLRNALSDLINETSSSERYQILRRISGEKIEFFPRIREDLNAVVIFDEPQRIAVFKPQFAYYQLKIPVFSSSEAAPKVLTNTQSLHDLKGLQFLAAPASVTPDSLETLFEAFGWDSYLAATHLSVLRAGGQISNGKTGKLRLNPQTNQIEQTLIWATYDDEGKIQAQ
ncbi:penicillin-binding protein activator [Thiomicrorhabdus sp.]|uniref:penicillin-binding protein activator n=1 Tax=Thiomicrorhabdus sp. TaxID=2039724 RepID=UPI0029C8FEFB|nr:penicillin-binding protein activator [Thiomicrorhabdus sp.]